MKKFPSIITFAAILLTFCGCAAPKKTSPPRDGELAGTFWRPVKPMNYTYIEFTGDGRMVGSTGRNRFFGPVAYARGKRLRLGPLAISRAPRMTETERQYEEEFISRIEATRGYVLDGDTLTLYNEERQPVMKLLQLKPQRKQP